MALARCIMLVVGSLSMLRAGIVRGADAKPPRTDLYGDPLPPGAVMRLGTIRLRHDRVDVTFSKDGKQLISFGCDGELRAWDVATGRPLHPGAGHDRAVEVLAASPETQAAQAALRRLKHRDASAEGRSAASSNGSVP